MTRKHYIQIARVFEKEQRKYLIGSKEYQVVQHIVEDMSDILADDNAAFDRVRFITACGF